MEPTDKQKETLRTIAKLINPNFGYLFFLSEGSIHMIDIHDRDIGYFANYQILAEHLKGELAKWYAKNFAKLVYMESGIDIADIEPAKIYAANGVFDSQDDMNRHYAARAEDLFGDHAMLNQDSETDGY